MKTEKNIFIAFILNIMFSIFEFVGGLFTNSIAIISDSIHDFGDAVSVGISFFLEKKSKRNPDNKYTYGYLRYSILGALITTTILIVGSIFVIIESSKRIVNPLEINYNGMIIFALVGVVVNFIAVYYTKEGDSINQKAVNLHMLEDVLGWIIVLIGSFIIKYTNFYIIDPIMSILVALFILYSALKNFKFIVDLFLEKIPSDISIDEIKKDILKIENVKDVHHIHIWSIDGVHNYATMHVVVAKNNPKIKNEIRETLKKDSITHVTIEIENKEEKCHDLNCHIDEVNHN